jgi:hypothetical protein
MTDSERITAYVVETDANFLVEDSLVALAIWDYEQSDVATLVPPNGSLSEAIQEQRARARDAHSDDVLAW